MLIHLLAYPMEWCRFFLLSLLVVSIDAWANQCSNGLSPQFQRLSLEHGLSQSVVTAITEDRSGYIWFGTQEGLNRFDGTTFQVSRRTGDGASDLPDNQINTLITGADGTVWIGTPRGIAARSPGQATLIRPALPEQFADDYILSMAIDGSDRLWVGSTRGLMVYDPKAKERSTTIWVGEGGRRLDDEHIRDLLIDRHQQLWIATAKGIYRINLANGKWLPESYLADANVSTLLERLDGQIVASSQFGVFAAPSGKQPEFVKMDLPLPSLKIQAITEDPDGRLWIATDKGVLIDEQNEHCLLTRDAVNNRSLSSSDVMSMHVDSQGIIWLGTYTGGVSFWDTRQARFQHHLIPWRLPKTVSSNTVTALVRDHHGDRWFGLAGNGLVRKRGRDLLHFPFPSLDNSGFTSTISSLLEDKNGALWVGVYGEGLFRIDAERRTIQHFVPDKENINTLSSLYLHTLYEDHTGQLWIGTEAGLDRVIEADNQSVRFQRYGALLPLPYQTISTEVVAISEDYLGQLWIGGQGGLVRISADREHMELMQHDQSNASSLSNTSITTIRLAGNGDIWVGTQEGFNTIRRDLNGKYLIDRHHHANQLPIGTVYGLLPGLDGDIWVATATGLFRYNIEKQYALQYRVSNGLPSDEFNQGAYYLAADGELMFGTINGAVSFYPRKLDRPRENAPVILTAIRQYDQALHVPLTDDQRAMVAVDADVRVLSFDYSILDFAEMSRNRLRYRVAGLHDQWINLIRSNTVTLSGLEPGRYRLEVQGAPAKGVWSDSTHVTEIAVRSPFWSVHMTYGGVIALIVLLGSVGWLVYFKITRDALKNERVTAQEALQESELLQRQSAELVRSHQLQTDAMNLQERELNELRQRLLDAQQHDALTGLPSRRYALPLFTELSLVVRQRCLLLVDVDSLSVLNEQHGLMGGDRILTQFAQLLVSACRDDDQVLRWHGGTFLLVCNVESINEVKMLCERIKARVLQHAFMLSERKTVDLTCSIGFATWPLCMKDPEPGDWQISITMAEEALFLSKHFGRNCWFGFFVQEGGSLTGRLLTQRHMIREGVQQEWLSMASSITLPVNFAEDWPHR